MAYNGAQRCWPRYLVLMTRVAALGWGFPSLYSGGGVRSPTFNMFYLLNLCQPPLGWPLPPYFLVLSLFQHVKLTGQTTRDTRERKWKLRVTHFTWMCHYVNLTFVHFPLYITYSGSVRIGIPYFPSSPAAGLLPAGPRRPGQVCFLFNFISIFTKFHLS